MKHLKTLFSLILFLSVAYLGFQIISTARENQVYKKDYAELNHFKYGLFSINAWKQRLSVILRDEIEKFDIDANNEKLIEKQLQKQLGVLIDKAFEKISKENNRTPSGALKQGFINTFIDVDTIKKGLPEYSKAIMKELKRPGNQEKLKGLVRSKLEEYMHESFDVTDSAEKTSIIRKMASENEAEAKAKIKSAIERNHHSIQTKAWLLIALAIVIFLLEGFNRKPIPQPQFFILCLTLLVLLAAGVTTPIIDMEAKIGELSFVLLEHKISFHDQVMYFQSKSIMDVFHIMINHKELQMKFVGILMVCFSLVFPVFKMLSSLAYYYDYCHARNYKIVQFFVLKSGKWSMADVLVVAIFMSFIGFNGIINSQLDDLKSASESVNVMTTNGTNLQPGFYLFITYTMLAMFLAGFLKKRPYCPKP